MLGALTAEPESELGTSVRQGRFFLFFGLLQVWSIAAGFVVGVGFTLGSAIDAIVLLVCLLLAFSKSRPLHVAGLALVWIAYLASAVVDIQA